MQVLFTSTPPSGPWRDARRLRLVQMMGVGVEELLPAPELPDEVAITCLRGVFAAEVAEHVFAMALALVRGVPVLVKRREARVALFRVGHARGQDDGESWAPAQ